MAGGNQTPVKEFILLGFSGIPRAHAFLFLVFFTIYLLSMIGNTTLITLIRLDSRLHSPMYYFLSHLSCLDVCNLSVTVPKILANLASQKSTISYKECMAQMFFLMTSTGTESILLAVMAYDRYAAICQPLHYNNLMSSQVYVSLAIFSWLGGILNSATHTALATNLSFCGANRIDHIFCDVPPLLKITCSDTYVNEMVIHIFSIFMAVGPFLLIVISYVYIVSAILRIRSNTSRRKAFSTCSSHVAVVIIHFGMANVNYNRPGADYSSEVNILVSTLYCIITPMLNPLIYSFRNKDVKNALGKVLGLQRKAFTSPKKQ
ncbi:olfactory receptor 5T7-like [Heteronotia binoei]|uniref:olfactory receptor 5T7-like n=1 Tax=Heteronotia binoei TaxID=13085 RepID=UPI00292E3892|nr:olfactory receptor 5T7-like [Heteronotia binoei]